MTAGFPEPRSNPHLFGHADALARFGEALARGRLHHAWMLTGPQGIGKATLAWHLARRLLADIAEAERAHDPGSALFRRVASGAHPDLFALEAGRGRGGRTVEIGVAAVRELLERVHGTAWGSRRVVLVDPADALGRSAANAMLKLLEEPPEGLVFLLVVHRPAALPATIASRCLRLPLSPLDRPTVERALTCLLPDHPPEQRARLAELCEGRLGRAALYADGAAFELYERLLDWLGKGAPTSAMIALVAALEAHARITELEAACAIPALLVRRCVLLRIGRPPGLALVADENRRLALLAQRAPLEALASLWEKLDTLPRRIEGRHLDPGQALITALDALGRTLAGPVTTP